MALYAAVSKKDHRLRLRRFGRIHFQCGRADMNYQALIERITQAVDERAYFTPTSHLDAAQRAVLAELERRMGRPEFEVEPCRAFVRAEHAAGRLDRVHLLSALHVLACHPKVADWEEAARLCGEQELAALELGGPQLDTNLAAVERHRGVLAFLRHRYEVALDYFARALERQRTAENFTNVLAALLRLGELDEAQALLRQARASFPAPMVAEVDRNVSRDPDLALLRTEAL
jgi:tetratricopeptide (TPR) repeat protein